MKMKPFFTSLMTLLSFFALAQDPLDLPLFQMQNLEYEGAFRLPSSEYGISNLNFSEGPIEYNPDRHSIFIVGHAHEQAIAEFSIPEIKPSSELLDLEMSGDPLQEFASILDRAESGNTQNINRIGGLKYINGSLLVNGYEYYDANGDVTHSTLRISDADNLSNSVVEGYFSFQGGAGQTSGWISPLPSEWSTALDADYMIGQSSGIPIISRTSVGPTAFALNMDDFPSSGLIQTSQYLDFSYPNGIHEDLDNSEGENDKWTHLSRVIYGFVVPGTRTYLTIGHSGGHESGVCYKCVQDDGNLCGGYCTPIASDNYQYYWLWDMRDLMEVHEGLRAPHEVQPYAYGQFVTPFQDGFNELGGGSYDPGSNRLFMSVKRADRAQGTYANPPVIVVYKPQTSSVLPATWISFEGRVNRNFIDLKWEVDLGTQHDFLTIEKLDGENWVTLGKVIYGNEFIDRTPSEGENIYRLKQVDLNGLVTYSHTITVKYNNRKTAVLFPNPVKDVLQVRKNDNEVVKVYNISGRMLASTSDSNIDVTALESGIYIAHIGDEWLRFIKIE